MNTQSPLTKTWILVRYAVEINHHSPLSSPNSASSSSNERQQFVFEFYMYIDIHWLIFFYRPQRQIIDCSEGLLSLRLTTTQQLYILRDETEKLESVDLLSYDSSSIIATYTGDSLLISYFLPHDNIQRKFLIKFASTAAQNAYDYCKECVTYLSRFISITHFDSIKNPMEKSNSILSMTDMIKLLMGENSIKLSSYYTQDILFDSKQSNDLLEKYLSDETFPDFVANVAAILDSMKENEK